MRYSITGKNIELTPDIHAYIAKKMASLGKYGAHFGTAAEAHVEAGRTTRHHRTGNILGVEIGGHVPRKELRAESLGATIFEAMDKARDEIDRELERHKEKNIDLKKSGARMAKKMLRGEI